MTRDSVITLANDLGIEVEIRKISVTELENGLRTGAVSEAFGVGTAATIKSIDLIGVDGTDYPLNTMPAELGSSVAMQLSHALDAIRRGKADDTHGWSIPV